MTTIALDAPDPLVLAARDMVKSGMFRTEAEVFLAAMAEFVRRNRVDLIERFALEDINWVTTELVAGRM
jgi:hypothetical protein